MSQYLLLHCGPYRLLLGLAPVVEIGADAEAATSGWRLWRERQLRVVDLARYLDTAAAPRRQQIVLRDAADSLHVIDVDRVERLLELDESRFATLADLTPALACLVDGVALEAGHCLLRLRQPFAWSQAPDALETPS